jgi:hypothetical protein
MKYLVLTVLMAAACVLAAPSQAQQTPSYSDARSTASDEEVRIARRAYRAACQESQSLAYCECMTGGMAQALVPADLAVATALLQGRSVNAAGQQRTRVEAMRADVDRGCAQFRSE